MTPDDVRQKVDKILARGDVDPERNHLDEDKLTRKVLRSVAKGSDDAQALAREVLRLVEDDSLTRWYA